jgi:hypothetical protein
LKGAGKFLMLGELADRLDRGDRDPDGVPGHDLLDGAPRVLQPALERSELVEGDFDLWKLHCLSFGLPGVVPDV